MKISKINDMWKCQKYAGIKALDLILDDKKLHVMYQALELMKQMFEKGELDGSSAIRDFIDTNYDMNWFSTELNKKSVVERDFALLERMYGHFSKRLKNGSKILKTNEPYEIPCMNIILNEQAIDSISGKADIILQEPNGNVEAIIFDVVHAPTLSSGARKPLNIPSNNLSLIALKLGLEPKYSNISVSYHYLKGKNDSGTSYPPYNEKRGANIITENFLEYYSNGLFMRNQLIQHFRESLKIPSEKKCETCFYQQLCNSYHLYQSVETSNTEHHEHKPESKKVTTTEQQNRVIRHVNGPMHVVAVPGAGKTHSLVQRMVHMIEDCKINPRNFLFLTFTNKACNEIKERVSKAIGLPVDDPRFPNIFTFNAFCYKILRDNANIVGKVRLANDIDRQILLNDVLSMVPPIQGVRYDNLYGKYGVLTRIMKWIDSIYLSGESAFRISNPKLDVENIIRVFRMYDKCFHEAGYISYDDQVNYVNQLFDKRPDLLEKYSKLYRYIMVDEYQDVNEEQNELSCRLASFHQNIVIVGDDDQSIYEFRGGSNQYILNFKECFKNSEMVIMNDNFRSNDKICYAANSLIMNNNVRFEKNIVAHKTAAYSPIMVYDCSMETLDKYLAAALQKTKPYQIAILARRNKTLEDIQEKLQNKYSFNSPKSYLRDDPVFLTLFDILSLYFIGLDKDTSLFRLMRSTNLLVPADKGTNKSLYKFLVEKKCLMPIDITELSTYKNYQEYMKNNNETDTYLSFGYRLFQCFKILQYSSEPLASIDQLAKLWFGEKYNDVNVQRALEKISELSDERYIGSLAGIYRYMHDLIQFEDTTRVEYVPNENQINLLTAHDSKGKEFDVVIVHGVDEFTDADEEERRVLYVAMTRAKSNLILTTIGGKSNCYPAELDKTNAITIAG